MPVSPAFSRAPVHPLVFPDTGLPMSVTLIRIDDDALHTAGLQRRHIFTTVEKKPASP
jgi:hypothetical protein